MQALADAIRSVPTVYLRPETITEDDKKPGGDLHEAVYPKAALHSARAVSIRRSHAPEP